METVQTILFKHKAATGFFTAMTNTLSNTIKAPGDFTRVIKELEVFIATHDLSEAERVQAQVFLKGYRRLLQVSLLPTDTGYL